VTVWEDQAALFDAALERFKTIDVVVANAGVAEMSGLGQLEVVDGKPVKPNLLTTEVNIVGVLYSQPVFLFFENRGLTKVIATHLAIHYLRESYTEGALKSLIYLSSMGMLPTVPHMKTD
jgi:NAD(P)-dependent dehydrogenase (short-subunit alcohol dehydrogenase family)